MRLRRLGGAAMLAVHMAALGFFVAATLTALQDGYIGATLALGATSLIMASGCWMWTDILIKERRA